ISVPAPHGGFIVLPLVNKPFLWVLWIVVGALVSGALLALIAGRFAKKEAPAAALAAGADSINGAGAGNADNSASASYNPGNILALRNIVVDVDVASRDDALKYLADLAVKNSLASDREQVLTAYLKREEESTTGMTDGFAIPHAQSPAIANSAMLVLKLKHPVDWNSLDGQKIDTVISFLIPQVDSDEHLKYLSNTAKLLTHQDFIAELRAAKTPQAIMALFKAQ
ncbi:PTS fructose transporter subunit IIABC, partial [Lactobacillus sp. XV13L]|nr:PTS fructose transporter subunit IIABC [Lactobacillus sp. XV13L]